MKFNKTLLATLCAATLASSTSHADQVFGQDTIVQGSLCAGTDCSDGESFGFNTLVLKENNLRLRFQDTSSSSSFPTNDWILEANSSQNGGGEYFAIINFDAGTTPFLVDKSAPNAALRVTGTGLGVGVDPITDLHIMSGDTPVVRVEQSGTLGWAPAAWDLGANESNFFIRDVTGSTVPFRILPGAATDAVVVEVNGDLSIGGVVNEGSSRDIKYGVVPVRSSEVLERVAGLSVSRWKYVTDSRDAEHMGPMAEDFHQAFGLGGDNRHIAALDLAGVAVSSVQGLHALVQRQTQELDTLRRKNASLEARLERLEALVTSR